MTSAARSWKPYPAYKDSGVEWLGKVPEGWKVQKLKHVVKVNLSNVDKKSNEGETTVKLCNYVDVYYNDYITPDLDFMEATASPDQIDKFTLRGGDVIITKDSESWEDIAVPAYVPANLNGVICGYHLAHIRPNNLDIDGEYLFWSFCAPRLNHQFRVEAHGITRFGIGKYSIDNSLLLVPSINDQKYIARFLDDRTRKIDSLIEKKQKLIELLKEERAAVINQAVTKGLDPRAPMRDSGVEWLGEVQEKWEVKKLKHIAEIVLGKMLTNDDKGGYFYKPYLRAQNISWQKVNTEDIKQMWFSEKELEQYRVKLNDLLVSEGGEVGRTAIWNNVIKECYIQNSVHKVTMLNGNNPYYFLYLFFLYGQMGYFDSIVSKVSIAHLTREKLKEVFCPVPSITEQNQIVQYIEYEHAKIDRAASTIEKEIELLQEYRTALISEAVTGKIDVREEVV